MHVRAILESSGFFSEAEVVVAEELVQERLAKGLASGYEFLFAERAGNVFGYACFGPIACTLASYDLYWIAVHETARGDGIGTTLLRNTEALIAAQGGTRLYIETASRPQYEPTRQFYRRRGYQPEAILQDFYAPGDDKVIFVKAIQA
ncbi:GNAT family N-acetyltransferase [candidate division KSB3 bacterium]|uniref:GNAT family N-acetyltransferase n=1 Tax=candidate division KSB3 bacterium TaxID=2044937 RepID=A0A9D5K094_9BACT|nr:GNAT family N-acetyltransferase [candidate division KSB3 bacterium]MBD3327026.1 GNAT family N-acetyltransferase [candidate division KSB3 bacterium]